MKIFKEKIKLDLKYENGQFTDKVGKLSFSSFRHNVISGDGEGDCPSLSLGKS